MSYPDLPNNRLIVNGIDLTEKFKMVLLDGYTLSPPAPKTYVVDIPGGNGKLDLTEALFDDVVYDNRSQKFNFAVVYPKDFEKIKTEVSNFLHGRSFDYTMTMDPGYTYHGRFSINNYTHTSYSNGKLGVIEVSVDADPYKVKPVQTLELDCIGGKIYNLVSGRKRVRPSIMTDGYLKVIYKDTLTVLKEGTWKINDVYFKSGENEIYFNSHDIHNLKWGELKTKPVTWGAFAKNRLFEWYRFNGSQNIIRLTWGNLSAKTWDDYKDTKWSEIVYGTDEYIPERHVYISYEWGDL